MEILVLKVDGGGIRLTNPSLARRDSNLYLRLEMKGGGYKSPNWAYSPSKWPFLWLMNRGY